MALRNLKLLLFIMFVASRQGIAGDSRLIISCKGCADKQVEVFKFPLLIQREETLFSGTFDAAGIADIQLSLQDSVLALIGTRSDSVERTILGSIYLETSTLLYMDVDSGKVSFRGKLSLANTYLNEIFIGNRKRSALVKDIRDNYAKLPKDKVGEYFSNLRSLGLPVQEKILGDDFLPGYQREFLYSLNNEFELKERLYLNFQRLSTKAKLTKEDLRNFLSKFSVDHGLLGVRSWPYTYFMGMNLNMLIKSLLIESQGDERPLARYHFIRRSIEANQIGSDIDFIMARSISTDAVLDGLSFEDLNVMVNAYRTEFPASKYIAELQKIVFDRNALAPGQPMRDFALQDKNGKTFRLSDFKGSVIYIDVWATWCGPCIAEFKNSIALSKKYSDRNIVFLYVSKDSNVSRWREYLEKDQEFKGIHGIQPIKVGPPAEDDVMRLYKINGIPRYIIIGKDGRIVDYNASRPSELLTSGYLDALF